MLDLIICNLEKVAMGIALFAGSYIANMGLGAWKNVKVLEQRFDWALIINSLLKFTVLVICIGITTIVVTTLPIYAQYVGIEISAETMNTFNSLVIIGSFISAAIKYLSEAIDKIKTILS